MELHLCVTMTVPDELGLEAKDVSGLQDAIRTLSVHGLGPALWTQLRLARNGPFEQRSGPFELSDLRGPISWMEIGGAWAGGEVVASAYRHASGRNLDLRWTLEREAALIEPLVRWLGALRRSLPAHERIAGRPSLTSRDVLRRGPPRRGGPLSYDGLLDVLDTTDEDWAHGWLRDPLPAPAQRTIDGALDLLRWVEDPITLETAQRASLARQRWIASHLEPEEHDDWNAEGEERLPTYGASGHELVAGYFEHSRWALVPLDVAWNGDADERRLAELCGWLADGALPDGTPVAGFWLICPCRRAARAFAARARAIGMAAVHAIDGELWRPAPKGYVIDPMPLPAPALACAVEVQLPAAPSESDGAALLALFPRALGASGGPDELAWGRGPCVAATDPQVLVEGRGDWMRVRVTWPWRDGMSVVEPLAAAVRAFRAALPAGAYLVLASQLVPRGIARRGVRPPRTSEWWTFGALLDVVDTADDGVHDSTFPAALDRATAARRDTVGTLELLRWARDPVTHAELERACLAQERWLSSTDVGTFDDERWNEAGDRRITDGLVARPPLTLYAPETGAGYKVMVSTEGRFDTDFHRAQLEQQVALLAGGRLPDGAPLTSVTIVTSAREDAVTLAPTARDHGLGIAYAAGVAEVWELGPED